MSGTAAHRLNLVWTLIWQSFLPRNRRERARLVWVFLEPMGQTAMMLLLFSFIGRTPSYGDSFALFLMSGIVTLSLFSRGAALVVSAVLGLERDTRLQGVGPFHEAIAQVVGNAIIAVTYTSVLIWAVGALERRDTLPSHPEIVALAFFWVSALAFGVGLIRAYCHVFIPVVERAYAILSRVLIFVSGVFYAPSFMPPQVRDWLWWNPVLHGVELMRLGLYAEYPTIVYSATYLQGVALGSIALGMALVWRRRARLMG